MSTHWSVHCATIGPGHGLRHGARGLRRCEVLGLRLSTSRWPSARCSSPRQGGHQRVVPISNTFFAELGEYLVNERPKDASTNRCS